MTWLADVAYRLARTSSSHRTTQLAHSTRRCFLGFYNLYAMLTRLVLLNFSSKTTGHWSGTASSCCIRVVTQCHNCISRVTVAIRTPLRLRLEHNRFNTACHSHVATSRLAQVAYYLLHCPVRMSSSEGRNLHPSKNAQYILPFGRLTMQLASIAFHLLQPLSSG